MKYFSSLIVMALFACAQPQEPINPEIFKQEVASVEKAFTEMAGTKGVPAAFEFFAADDVIMQRGKRLVKGKSEMKDYFDTWTFQKVKLEWEPTFVDVAASGDLAYTYGPYTFEAIDSSGETISDTGFFHTVWKRQKTGEWKFVWD